MILMKKRVISAIIILFFISIILYPCIDAKNPAYHENILTIWMPGITDEDYFSQIELSEEQLQLFNDKVNDTLGVINRKNSQGSTGKPIITLEEWQEISDNVSILINSIKSIIEDFPSIDTEILVSNVIESFFRPFGGYLRPKPFFSAGLGFTWIPFYGYETFFGLMIRPMFTRYRLGFSQVGGLTRTDLTIGQHLMVNICFCGLFINIGDIGNDRITGPTIYIGTVFLYRI
jgi:hypothetical protein